MDPLSEPEHATGAEAVKSCPQISVDVDTAASVFNATVYALKQGAFNNLSLMQLNQLTGHLMNMENRIRPYVS